MTYGDESESHISMHLAGRVSFVAVITGVLVAFGAIFLLAVLVGVVLVGNGVGPADYLRDGALRTRLATAAVLVMVPFFAYFWAGYTAGRMGGPRRGAVNGALVAILATAAGAAMALAVRESGTRLDLSFVEIRFPAGQTDLLGLGAGLGIAVLGATLIGGILGGAVGSRWHRRIAMPSSPTSRGILPDPNLTADSPKRPGNYPRPPPTYRPQSG
jgi:hypothetical protein